jgi:dipicolinate synthase subunit A
MSWGDLHIAVIGGDEREQEIARLAALEAGQVTAYGFPWPEEGIDGVVRADSPAEAARGASYALFPVPGIAADGSLFAPAATEPIVPDVALLRELRAGATVILGAADERLREAAAAASVDLVEYEHDRELMMLRGPAIVEGALELAIAHTDVTIHAAEVAVVGHGNIGALLARTLGALGARVIVLARNPAQRAAAHAGGAAVAPLDDMAAVAPRLAMVFSTVPAPVVDAEVLRALPPGSLVMDLAAPPGGVDLQAARDLGHTAIWARGLGRRAPVTVGASQWAGIRRRIAMIEAGDHPAGLG